MNRRMLLSLILTTIYTCRGGESLQHSNIPLELSSLFANLKLVLTDTQKKRQAEFHEITQKFYDGLDLNDEQEGQFVRQIDDASELLNVPFKIQMDYIAGLSPTEVIWLASLSKDHAALMNRYLLEAEKREALAEVS